MAQRGIPCIACWGKKAKAGWLTIPAGDKIQLSKQEVPEVTDFFSSPTQSPF